MICTHSCMRLKTCPTTLIKIESGSNKNVVSSCHVGADGALRTAVDAWYTPIPSTGRAHLAAAQ